MNTSQPITIATENAPCAKKNWVKPDVELITHSIQNGFYAGGPEGWRQVGPYTSKAYHS